MCLFPLIRRRILNIARLRLAFANSGFGLQFSYTGGQCDTYWTRINPGFSANGSPVDLIYWKEGKLHYPSAGVTMTRERYGLPSAVPSPGPGEPIPHFQYLGAPHFGR